MKRIYSIILASCFLLASGQAQNLEDALRFSQNFYGGTARSMSMSGAFGALGGDFTSASLNPAGIGVYRSTELTLTPTILFDNTLTDYLGNTREENQYQFVLNNLGFVKSILTGRDKGWVGITFGLGYNQLNNYNRNTLMSGVQLSGDSQSSSYLDHFTENANDGIWRNFYEGLAEAADLMPFDTLAWEYWNDINNAGYGQSQRRRIQEMGNLGEIAFSLAANYSNKLYMGATIGIHRMNYTKYNDHTEIDDGALGDGLIPYFESFTFRETLDMKGTGYTFKAGLVYRPVSMVRIGAAFHIPTFYKIKEDFYTDISSTFDEGSGGEDQYVESDVNHFEYWLVTPYKLIGSVAVHLGKIALISADYEYMNYSKANFDTRDNYDELFDENDAIRAVYKAAHNIRTGAEVHFGPLYLRGGFAFYGSPYKSSEINSDAWHTSLSGGLGFRSNRMFCDLAVVRRSTDLHYKLYYPEDVKGADISATNLQMAATIGFRF